MISIVMTNPISVETVSEPNRLIDETATLETLYLCSIPGLQESILLGMNTPLEECVECLDWKITAFDEIHKKTQYRTSNKHNSFPSPTRSFNHLNNTEDT